MPDWLWWLSPVLVAPMAAVAWTAWTGRSRGPEHPDESMRAYERFRDALGSPLPTPARGAAEPAVHGPGEPAAVTLAEDASAGGSPPTPHPALDPAPALEQLPGGPAPDVALPVPAAARLPRQSVSGTGAQEPSRS